MHHSLDRIVRLRALAALTTLGLLAACGGAGYAEPDALSSNISGPAPAPPGASAPASSPGTSLSLVAGSVGGSGNLDGAGAAARFYFPEGSAVDAAGNLFVADTGNSLIRKISPSGLVSTFAGVAGAPPGAADGNVLAASFRLPQALCFDATGRLFVLDAGNGTVRIIDGNGVVSTFVGTPGIVGSSDGVGAAASFNMPNGMAIDAAGNLYVNDTGNETIRKITPAGVVSTLAGAVGSPGSTDGTGSAARFNALAGIASDSIGTLYVTDSEDQTIRKITPAGVVTTLAGILGSVGARDGPAAAALFNHPTSIAIDAAGTLYVTDSQNDAVRAITPAGIVSTIAGSPGISGSADGIGAAARFNDSFAISTDSQSNLYVSDGFNNTIRKITVGGNVTTLAGSASIMGAVDGQSSAASFDEPYGITADPTGNLYVADVNNATIRKITPGGLVSTFAGTAKIMGSTDGSGGAARFSEPIGVYSDSAGTLYVSDTNNNAIRKITPAGGVTTLAGGGTRGSADGTGAAARFFAPIGVTGDASGNIFVADTANSTIRAITPAGMVTTLAGTPEFEESSDGTGAAAAFSNPRGICIDTTGNLFVADTDNNTIRKVTSAGVVSTLAGTASPVGGAADGTGPAAVFNAPIAIACDPGTGNLYVSDANSNTVRKVTPAGVVTTVIGTLGKVGLTLGTLPSTLGAVKGLAVSGNRLLIVSDGAVLQTALP